MHWLTPLFVGGVVASSAVGLWLSERQAATVARHRNQVPAPFADSVSRAEHGKAADYTIAKVRFGRIRALVDAALPPALPLGGGIAAVDALWPPTQLPQPWLGVAVIASVALVAQLVS